MCFTVCAFLNDSCKVGLFYHLEVAKSKMYCFMYEGKGCVSSHRQFFGAWYMY